MLELFEVRMPIAELVIRGSAIFWFLFLIFRFIMRRDVGAVGVADVLLLVIIADASQNAMAGEYKTITEGFILVSTIVAWNWLIDYLSFRFKAVRRVLTPRRLTLVTDGQLEKRNLKSQYITHDELEAKLREQGIDSLRVVKKAYLEADGQISVIKFPASGSDADSGAHPKAHRPV